MFKLFQKDDVSIEKRIPKPNERWVINSGDPFPPKSLITILDVKEGWVRFYIGSFFDDERHDMDTFLHIYKFYDEGKKEFNKTI